MDKPGPNAVEKHPWDDRWHERLEEQEALWQGEGASIRSATGEGAYWIVHEDWMAAELILYGEPRLFEEDKPMLAELTRLERYDDREKWEQACDEGRASGHTP